MSDAAQTVDEPALRCIYCDDPLGWDEEVERAHAGVLVCDACVQKVRYLEAVR